MTEAQADRLILALERIADVLEGARGLSPLPRVASSSDDAMLTTKQVAEKCQVSEDTVLDWLSHGDLKGRRVGNRWRIPVGSLREWQLRVENPSGVVRHIRRGA